MAISEFRKMLLDGSILDKLVEDFPDIQISIAKSKYQLWFDKKIRVNMPFLVFAKHNDILLTLVDVASYGVPVGCMDYYLISGIMSYQIKDTLFLKVRKYKTGIMESGAFKVNSYRSLVSLLKKS